MKLPSSFSLLSILSLSSLVLSQGPSSSAGAATTSAVAPTTSSSPPSSSSVVTRSSSASSAAPSSSSSSTASSPPTTSSRPPAVQTTTNSNGSVQTVINGVGDGITGGSSASSAFQLGTAGIAAIVVVCIAILFAGIAFFVIRQRNKNKLPEESMLNLEEMSMSHKPAPPAPGSHAVPLVLALNHQTPATTIERKAGSPSHQFLYANQFSHQQQQQQQQQFSDPRYSQQTFDTYNQQQEQDQSQYSQQQINQWNAQTSAGIYTEEQVHDWCEQLRSQGYTEEDIQAWKSQQTIYSQPQIDEWYANVGVHMVQPTENGDVAAAENQILNSYQ